MHSGDEARGVQLEQSRSSVLGDRVVDQYTFRNES